ncbi:hypothetical protein BDP27DRAFT_1316099 [Rhodocollybia butyracea]|uniref:Phosphatidylglycerol/phosphatidylinositol transfer protein n=1 Tax=Rhodocollybia butyracea TaxID=206335 RepID=A0A9P5Q5R6_9AGAR|nr:hypothetical protein BDP27DRAFT_1316099 [Rhodocollybia butyracea]
MKFCAILLALVSTVVAQSASIAYPQDGTSFAPGSEFTLTIIKPNSLSASPDISAAIGIIPCNDDGSCPTLGTILFKGLFNPQYSTPPGSLPPHQNFTLQIPPTFSAEKAQIGVFRSYLTGAEATPAHETFATTIQVTSGTASASAPVPTGASRRSMRITGKLNL